MMRVLAVAMTVAGAVLGLFGLLFVVGAAGQLHRYVIAAVGLGAGAVFVGAGLRLWKRLEEGSSERVLDELLGMARRTNGEIAQVEVRAALGWRAPVATDVLARLVAAGVCERVEKDGRVFFVFADLQPRLFVRVCEYCDSEVSIVAPADRCRRCGGTLRMRVESRSVAKGAYRMDG